MVPDSREKSEGNGIPSSIAGRLLHPVQTPYPMCRSTPLHIGTSCIVKDVLYDTLTISLLIVIFTVVRFFLFSSKVPMITASHSEGSRPEVMVGLRQ
jgi:hypothetical protein